MNIIAATQQYEKWLTQYTSLVAPDLDTKHRLMASGAFPFLRATFYRWIQCWQARSGNLNEAPSVLAVGDLHIENYGTWRDAEGRLVWGINDFDEAGYLPYTQDLIRLLTSAYLAIDAGQLKVSRDDVGEAVLTGYTEQIIKGGLPFVVAEQHAWLRPIAINSLRDPVRFWSKMDSLAQVDSNQVSNAAVVALERMLPGTGGKPHYTLHRRVAGVGSLGHMRFVALTDYQGGRVAREAKALVPSAICWAAGSAGSGELLCQAIMHRAVRCHDPLVELQGTWIVRRLAPDCSKIDLSALPQERDELHLMKAMGQELANVHLGTKKAGERIEADLAQRKHAGKWYRPVVDALVDDVCADYEKWKAG